MSFTRKKYFLISDKLSTTCTTISGIELRYRPKGKLDNVSLYKGPVTLVRIGHTNIAVYTNSLSVGEITSPAENLRLTGMYFATNIAYERTWRIITGHKKNVKPENKTNTDE